MTRPAPKRRWLRAVIEEAAKPQPALPYSRAVRPRRASAATAGEELLARLRRA